jgi:hypothetical protein
MDVTLYDLQPLKTEGVSCDPPHPYVAVIDRSNSSVPRPK